MSKPKNGKRISSRSRLMEQDVSLARRSGSSAFSVPKRAALVTAQENLSALWRAGVFPRWNLSDKRGRGSRFGGRPARSGGLGTLIGGFMGD